MNNMQKIVLIKLKFLLSLSLIFSFIAVGETIKIAVVAPDGTNWAKSIKQMAKEINDETNGRVKIKLYLGGVQGDEPDVLRKIRISQLHGGIFTGRAMGDINGNSRLMEVPFTFGNDRIKAMETLHKMQETFNIGFEKNGFKNLGFFEIGQVYLVTTKKVEKYDDLKKLKIWAWRGDEIVQAFMTEMGLVSVPLPLPDVLSGLSTGLIDSAYSSPLGVVALQWSSKIQFLIDEPITFSIGAFLIDLKKWNKISKVDQESFSKISGKYIDQSNNTMNEENKESLLALKDSGVEFIKIQNLGINRVKVRSNILKALTGKLFETSVINKFQVLDK